MDLLSARPRKSAFLWVIALTLEIAGPTWRQPLPTTLDQPPPSVPSPRPLSPGPPPRGRGGWRGQQHSTAEVLEVRCTAQPGLTKVAPAHEEDGAGGCPDATVSRM